MLVPYYPKQKAYLNLFIPLYHCMLKILTARILRICSHLFGKLNPKDLKRVLTNKKAEGGLEMLSGNLLTYKECMSTYSFPVQFGEFNSVN